MVCQVFADQTAFHKDYTSSLTTLRVPIRGCNQRVSAKATHTHTHTINTIIDGIRAILGYNIPMSTLGGVLFRSQMVALSGSNNLISNNTMICSLTVGCNVFSPFEERNNSSTEVSDLTRHTAIINPCHLIRGITGQYQTTKPNITFTNPTSYVKEISLSGGGGRGCTYVLV